jgi:hypothetical protein
VLLNRLDGCWDELTALPETTPVSPMAHEGVGSGDARVGEATGPGWGVGPGQGRTEVEGVMEEDGRSYLDSLLVSLVTFSVLPFFSFLFCATW